MKIGIGLGQGTDAARAAHEAARQAKSAVPHPQLALAFAGIRLDQAKVHAALTEELGADVLLGGSTYAEITPAGVTKDSVAVLLIELEGLKATVGSMKLLDNHFDTGRGLAQAVGKPSGSGLPLGLMFGSVSDGYENVTLKEVVSALNELFSPATKIIYDCGGDVDKYVGDSIFAAFKNADDALRAGRLLLSLFKNAKKTGSPFSVRIGINSGRAIRANVGSDDRREYTYIGDSVNLAQRLEEHCSPGMLLISQELFESASVPFETVAKKEILVKGKRNQIVCYECTA